MQNDLAWQLVAKGTELTPQSQQAKAAISQRSRPLGPRPQPMDRWAGAGGNRWQPALVVPGPQASPRRQMGQGPPGPSPAWASQLIPLTPLG